MTGVEAAGLLLGVLPLMISAAEHYEDISRPFRRYIKFAPELQLYQQQLSTQKTIFRNECQKLLSMLIDRQTAKDMLKESRHYLWEDPELNEKMIRQLGNSASSCQATIDLIQAKLKEVEQETEKFGLAIQQSMPLGSIGDKAWRSRAGKKLKFSISEPRLEKCLEGLRKLNQDFRTLTGQTTWLNNVNAEQRDLSLTSASSKNKQKVKECKMVQNASVRLHQALERACRMHEAHSAHFRLESHIISVEDPGKSTIRFNMAFSHQPCGSSADLEPVWIAVESTFEETPEPSDNGQIINCEVHNALNGLSGTLKRGLSQSNAAAPVKRSKGKSVRFAPTAPYSGLVQAGLVPSLHIDPALPDFCVQHDFCAHLSKCNPNMSINRYIGCFEKSGPYKHLIYFAPPITSYPMKQSVSLAQIVRSMSQRSHADQLLQYERLRLARQLASAVLQYHATPLLRNSWRSDDVVFFGTPESTSSLPLPPHLNVQVGRSNGTEVAASNQEGKSPVHPYIRNPYLFNLGIILIEIAHQAPLFSLRSSQDPDPGQENRYNEYLLANRLSQSIGSSLGSSYGKVVRKCLGCDFGEGTADLGDPGLQAVFYRDVVCELERLERGFAKLQLGE